MLIARWKQILFGAAFQYVHGIGTQLAHRMHRPTEEPLHDVGFELLPELGADRAWVSETIFWCLFIPFVVWTFSPFVTARKRFYTAVIYARLLMVLTACQFLRILSFTVTQLPAPNYHCRLGRPTAVREMPAHWWGHVVVDVSRQVAHGCGDLIFSSHTTFVLVGCLTYTEYGTSRRIKALAWLGVFALSLCIVASRKHYTVDVLIAWYVVPLVFYAMLRRWTTVRPVRDRWPHRGSGRTAIHVLPGGAGGGRNAAAVAAAAAAAASPVPLLGPEPPEVGGMASGASEDGEGAWSESDGGAGGPADNAKNGTGKGTGIGAAYGARGAGAGGGAASAAANGSAALSDLGSSGPASGTGARLAGAQAAQASTPTSNLGPSADLLEAGLAGRSPSAAGAVHRSPDSRTPSSSATGASSAHQRPITPQGVIAMVSFQPDKAGGPGEAR